MGPHHEPGTARRQMNRALQSDSCKFFDSKRRDKSHFVERIYYLLEILPFPRCGRTAELHLPWHFALLLLRERSPWSQFCVTGTLQRDMLTKH